MKNKYIILAFTAITALFATSCNNFLDEMPDNRTELDSEEKIRKLLTSAYPSATYAQYLSVMTDDYDKVDEQYSASEERHLVDAWAWKDDKDEGNDSPKNTWESFYLAIAHANQALQAIEELGNPAHLNPLRGEALVARAWCHFKLVNVFCQHYTEEYGGIDLGIPYMEAPETEVNPAYERGAVKDVYEKIERDLMDGLPLIDDSVYDVPKYHFNRFAALGFASEFFLFYRKYDKCIEYANQVLGENPTSMIRDLTTFASLPIGEPQYRAYIKSDIKANLLLITNYSEAGLNAGYSFNTRYITSEILAKTEVYLSPSVLWRTSGITTANTFYWNTETSTSDPGGYFRCTIPYLFELRDPVARTGYAHSVMLAVTAETALLCRAEAHVLKETPDFQAAMEDINLWVKTRLKPEFAGPKTVAQVNQYYGGLEYYKPGVYTVKKILNPSFTLTGEQENFIHAILHLRRLEFNNDGTRWFDIKRYNIEIVRRVVDGANVTIEELDRLKFRDPRMAVQVPAGVIVAGLEANPR